MTESVFEDVDDILPPEPNGELVHWMEPRPLSVGAAGLSLTAAGAFALGVAATVTVLGLMRWLGPQRALDVAETRGWRKRRKAAA